MICSRAVADESECYRGTRIEIDRVETGQVGGGVRERVEGALPPETRRDVKAAVVGRVEGKTELTDVPKCKASPSCRVCSRLSEPTRAVGRSCGCLIRCWSEREIFLAYDMSYRGGVRVAAGDLTGDGDARNHHSAGARLAGRDPDH